MGPLGTITEDDMPKKLHGPPRAALTKGGVAKPSWAVDPDVLLITADKSTEGTALFCAQVESEACVGEQGIEARRTKADTELQKRMQETSRLQHLLKATLQSVVDSTNRLSDVVEEAEELETQLAVPLSVCQHRMALRRRQEARNMHQEEVDGVASALSAEQAFLTGVMKELEGCMREGDGLISVLDVAEHALKADLSSKLASLKVDEACMTVAYDPTGVALAESNAKSREAQAAASGPPKPPTRPPPEVKSARAARMSGAYGVLPTPRQQVGLPPATARPPGNSSPPGPGKNTKVFVRPTKSTGMPEQWRAETLKLVESAKSDVAKANHATKKMAGVVRRVKGGTGERTRVVEDLLAGKIKSEELLRDDLQQKIEETDRELLNLQTTKQHLTGKRQNQDIPMNVALQRVSLRKQRPKKETIRDGAEEALEVEIGELKALSGKLEKRLRQTEQEHSRLQTIRRQLVHQLEERREALDRDTRVLEVDASDLPSAKLPKSTPGIMSRQQTGGRHTHRVRSTTQMSPNGPPTLNSPRMAPGGRVRPQGNPALSSPRRVPVGSGGKKGLKTIQPPRMEHPRALLA